MPACWNLDAARTAVAAPPRLVYCLTCVKTAAANAPGGLDVEFALSDGKTRAV